MIINLFKYVVKECLCKDSLLESRNIVVYKGGDKFAEFCRNRDYVVHSQYEDQISYRHSARYK